MTVTYADLSMHRWMLRDTVRNEAYRKALLHAVKPGDVALDVGAGTGILSMFAAAAGARKVYAVERTPTANVARMIVETNGMSDRIEVLQSDLEEIELTEKVDVLVSEWMGGFGVDENMLAPVIIARDRFLAEGGRIVPACVTAYMAPVWVEAFDEELAYWRTKPHGIDLGDLSTMRTQEILESHSDLKPEHLLAEGQALWAHDAYTCTLEEADRSFVAHLTFTIAKAGKFSGLAAWFSADMGGGIVLATGVDAPPTHWGRTLFPLEKTIEVEAGTLVSVEFRCEPISMSGCEYYWSVKVGNGPIEEHDSRGRAIT